MSTGIVLGAGGPLGWAYHLGVLQGIEEVLDLPAADADRIVGTSAGGAVAASALSGAKPDDVLGAIGRPLSEEDEATMRAAAGERRRVTRLLRPLAPATALRRIPTAPITSLVGLLPGGVFPTFPLRRFPVPASWPSSLWLPSVRMDSGDRTVFGRDRHDVPLRDALEATSAVPGMFRPKQIDGVPHVDGAVASATHADLLADEGHDLVIVSSVMTRPGGGPIRQRARRQLRREVRALEASGTDVVVVEPHHTVIELAKGWPRSGAERGPEIVDAARRQTVTRLRERVAA